MRAIILIINLILISYASACGQNNVWDGNRFGSEEIALWISDWKREFKLDSIYPVNKSYSSIIHYGCYGFRNDSVFFARKLKQDTTLEMGYLAKKDQIVEAGNEVCLLNFSSQRENPKYRIVSFFGRSNGVNAAEVSSKDGLSSWSFDPSFCLDSMAYFSQYDELYAGYIHGDLFIFEHGRFIPVEANVKQWYYSWYYFGLVTTNDDVVCFGKNGRTCYEVPGLTSVQDYMAGDWYYMLFFDTTGYVSVYYVWEDRIVQRELCPAGVNLQLDFMYGEGDHYFYWRSNYSDSLLTVAEHVSLVKTLPENDGLSLVDLAYSYILKTGWLMDQNREEGWIEFYLSPFPGSPGDFLPSQRKMRNAQEGYYRVYLKPNLWQAYSENFTQATLSIVQASDIIKIQNGFTDIDTYESRFLDLKLD